MLGHFEERRLLWLLAVIQFTLVLDFMVMMPLGPDLMRDLDITPGAFGSLVSSYTIASAAVGFSGFFWLDRVPRRGTLLLVYAAFIGATAFCAAAGRASILGVARCLAGAAAGLLWSLVMAILVDRVPAERRGSAMGLVMTSYALSGVAGVPLGLALARSYGWRAPFAAVAALSFVAWLVAARLVPHQGALPAADEPKLHARGLEPHLLLGWVLTFCVVGAGFLLIPYLGAFMIGNLHLAPSLLPWVYLSGGAATFVTSRLVGLAVDRWGPSRTLAALLVASAAPHLIFTHLATSSFAVVATSFVLFMTITSGRMIPTVVLITARVPPAMRGRFMAVNTAMSDAASGLATWVGGALLGSRLDGELVGFGRVGSLAVGASTIALAVLWSVSREVRTQQRLEASG